MIKKEEKDQARKTEVLRDEVIPISSLTIDEWGYWKLFIEEQIRQNKGLDN